MPPELIPVRLTRFPSRNDWEFLSLRYLRVNGVYLVPVALASDLIEIGCAALADGSAPLTEVGEPFRNGE
jgi:hypothetical protein